MTHRLTGIYAKNCCNRTLIVKVIIENVVTCFLGHSVLVQVVYSHCPPSFLSSKNKGTKGRFGLHRFNGL